MTNRWKDKRAQITIFIIIALIIVVAIALIFVVWRKPTISISPEENPQAYIDSCVKDATKEAIGKVLEGGGRIEPELYKLYQSEKYNYLCYQKNYYLTCINHYPMLKNIVEQEITDYIEPEVRSCFSSLKEQLEKRNYKVIMGEGMEIITELQTRKVIVTAKKELEMTKNQETKKITQFKSQVLSSVYDLVMIAREIVNQESQYCNFEYNGFMLLYPRYDIKRISYDEDRIYNILDRINNEEFKFAIRSCAFPPGL